jgi:Transglycosylase SLT domain
MESASLPAAGPPKLLLGLPLALPAGLVAALLGLALLLGGSPGCGGGEAAGGLSPKVPARLAPLYGAAAARYELGGRGPSILAAINEVETGFGRDLGTSSAGAIGWMQFEPATWATYGVDANGDGRKDPYQPADAIFAAARLLRAAGAPGDWRAAIFTYNHAGWYVAKVLAEARRFAAPGGSTQLAGFTGCAAAALAPNEAIARMLAEAARLSALRPRSSYVWGGSHGATPTPPNGPFDCSSAVSHLLQVAGFRNPTMDTVALARWGESGPGRWVTIFVEPYGPQAHTFIGFNAGLTPPGERYWGTSGVVAPGKGPGWIGEDKLSNAYLAGFEMRHPPGL